MTVAVQQHHKDGVENDENLFKFEVIVSFDKDDMEQFFMDVQVSAMPEEDEFIDRVLSNFSKPELEHLCKLSVCQIRRDQNDLICPWILARNGKFFFNVDVNTDADTAKWNDARNVKLATME